MYLVRRMPRIEIELPVGMLSCWIGEADQKKSPEPTPTFLSGLRKPLLEHTDQEQKCLTRLKG